MFLLCELGFLRLCDLGFDVTVVLMMCWLGLVGFGFWLVSLLAQVSHHGFTSQFKFPSPFTRAYLHSPQLVQEAL